MEVTLSLSQKSVDFFKREAKKQHVPYQRVIRAVVVRMQRGESTKGKRKLC